MELEIENFRVKESRRRIRFGVENYKNVLKMNERMIEKYFRPRRIWPEFYTDFLNYCLRWNFNPAIVKKIVEVKKVKKIVIEIIEDTSYLNGITFCEVRFELNLITVSKRLDDMCLSKMVGKNVFFPFSWYRYENLDEFRNTFLPTFRKNCSLLGMKYFDKNENYVVRVEWEKNE